MIPTREEMINALKNRQGSGFTDKLLNSTVAVCGLGGLGSNIATALTRAGVGRLILIDFDRVDVSNLHRQQYKINQVGIYKTEALLNNLKEISPYIEIVIHSVCITENNICEILEEADIICEAFDNAEAKAMLIDTVIEKMPRKYIVSASGMAGMGDADDIKTKKITKHFYLCGDEKSEVSENNCLIASRVMLCAAHQAHKVLQILYELEKG